MVCGRFSIRCLCILYLTALSQGKVVTVGNDNSNDYKNADQAKILNGIDELHSEGAKGFLTVFGSDATPILAGLDGNVLRVLIAAGHYNLGKMVGYSHTGFLYPEFDPPTNPGEVASLQLILNSVRWASKTETDSPSVAILENSSDNLLENFLLNKNISTTILHLDNLENVDNLIPYDVLIIHEPFDESKVPILLDYVSQGGGIAIALTAWAYNTPQPFRFNFIPNMLVVHAGFLWQDRYYADATLPNGNFNASTDLLVNTHTEDCWHQITTYLDMGNEYFLENQKQIVSIFERDLNFIPRFNEFFTGEMYNQAKEFVQDSQSVIPTPTETVPVIAEKDKILLKLFHIFTTAVLFPMDIPAYPGSKNFPGDPLENNSQKETVYKIKVKVDIPSHPKHQLGLYVANKIQIQDGDQVNVTHTHDLWYSTGLYAPAGQVVTIVVDNFNSSNNENLNLYRIRIGCHKDDLSNLNEWYRPPVITLEVPLVMDDVTMSLSITSPYGGLLYIVAPDQEEISATLSLSIGGVVKAPYFKLGQTLLNEWLETLRYESGPWTEFETDSLVLAAPTELARNVDNPEELLLLWTEIMDGMADLASIPRQRYRQERIVPDIQISAGFMHSGYPIMTFLESTEWSVNVSKLKLEGSWGHLHELGHNHQQGVWTFDGTGEVTCNLFALYTSTIVIGLQNGVANNNLRPDIYIPKIEEYIKNGLKYNDWKANADLGLIHYYQLENRYGWTTFKSIFAQYHDLPQEEYPSNDQEKIDLWVVMFSKKVGENLQPFFESWGIPMGGNVGSLIGHLPRAPLMIQDLLDDFKF